jgi:hypothetical protein
MTHYDEQHLTVGFDETLEAVVMEWHEFVQGDPYREGLETGLELVEQRDARNWLADLRQMGTVADGDKQWTNENWFPEAIASSLQHMAIIKPESVVANMSVENIIQEVDGDLVTRYFDNRQDAEAWLDEQELTV